MRAKVRESLAGLCAAALAVVSMGSVAYATDPFTIAIIPDTQFYSAGTNGGSPSTFNAQTQWILDHRVADNIVFATHMGDLVDDGSSAAQWTNALTAMNSLSGVLPYSSCFGNHDLHWDASTGNGIANSIANFGNSTHEGGSSYGGTTPNGLSFYQTFSASGYSFLHINLNFTPDAATLSWVQTNVINTHLGVPTIISTHDYLNVDGVRDSVGDSIWNGLVNNNPQVFMVLNGHYHGEAQLISTDASGKKVAQMVSDYQNYPAGGNGFMRELTFDPDAGQIRVSTFSPTLGQAEVDANSRFTYSATFNADKTISINNLVPRTVPPPALRGWWKMDETSGTTAADSSAGWSPSWLSPAPAAMKSNGKVVGGSAAFVTGAGRDGGSALLLTNTAAGGGYVQLSGGTTGTPATNLGEQTFTISAWIKRTGTGVTASSGTGGVVGVPIVAKGVGEGDNANIDANFFFGIDASNHLCADFETYTLTVPGNPGGAANGGTNFPITGTRTLPVDANTWHHVAVTWDGLAWRLYVDGTLDASRDWASAFAGAAGYDLPRYDSVQMAAIGATLNSGGAVAGGFYGYIDDVRIYEGALNSAEVAALAVVPEPGSLGVLLLAGSGLLRRRRNGA